MPQSNAGNNTKNDTKGGTNVFSYFDIFHRKITTYSEDGDDDCVDKHDCPERVFHL